MSKQLVWLDCDPGHDDSFAIILAAYSPQINLIGISTIAGNQTIEKTTQNALTVMNLAGLIKKPSQGDGVNFPPDVGLKDSLTHAGMICPLVQGNMRPLLRPGKICEEIHGDSGLNTHVSLDLPEIPPHARNYVRFINYECKSSHFTTKICNYFRSIVNDSNANPTKEKITIICTGPLTNIALLLINHPEVLECIDKLILMGGAMGIGNTGPVSEFNIQVDPEAAAYIFDYSPSLSIYMVPLEVTHTVIANKSVLDTIKTRMQGSKLSTVVIELLLYFASTYERVFFMREPPLHDPCAVAYAAEPSMFAPPRLMRVDVETHSTLSYGQTVCDIYGMSAARKNVHVCESVDVDRFWTVMLDALVNANENSPANNNTK